MTSAAPAIAPFPLSPLADPGGSIQGAPPARRSLIICATPRSGSWLLAGGLDATGLAGHPREYFRADYQRLFLDQWGVPAVRSYADFVACAIQAATSDNGVCAFKAHWDQFASFLSSIAQSPEHASTPRAALADRFFPSLRYVLVSRADKAAQAVSWYRALATERWWVLDGDPGQHLTGERQPTAAGADPAPDIERIAQLESIARQQEGQWRRYFQDVGIAPLEVTFEELCADYAGTVKRVLRYVGIPLPVGFEVPPARLRRQADETTDRSLQPYRQRAAPTSKLAEVLSSRRWTRYTMPFPYLVAEDVFTAPVYRDLENAYRDVLARPRGKGTGGFARNMQGYDAWGWDFTADLDGPFAIFVSPDWHRMLAAALGVNATGHISGGLHHHDVGSRSGALHNDYNPVYFPEGGRPGQVRMVRTDLVNYLTGEVHQPGVAAREVVRAGAMIYFVNNAMWRPGDGGSTGFYRTPQDRLEYPAVVVPPRNNTLVLFETTPWSYHAFLRNHRHARNSVILWLHRERDDAVARWSAGHFVRF